MIENLGLLAYGEVGARDTIWIRKAWRRDMNGTAE
jgi:hypothetical protein